MAVEARGGNLYLYGCTVFALRKVRSPFGCEDVVRGEFELYLFDRGLRFWGCCAAHRGRASLLQEPGLLDER
jgi:hypothetical protein